MISFDIDSSYGWGSVENPHVSGNLLGIKIGNKIMHVQLQKDVMTTV